MNKQHGYINLDGLFMVLGVLSAFGLFGIFALGYWAIPAAWSWLKPWLHAVTG